MLKLNAQELRNTEPTQEQVKAVKRRPIYIILDNVLDTYNVGSIFRLADAVGAQKIYLCGETLTPPNPRIKKASISTWKWVEWEYVPTAVEAIEKLKTEYCHPEVPIGILNRNDRISKANKKDSIASLQNDTKRNLTVIAVEQDKRSIAFDKFDYQLPVALVVGNESFGVSKEVLDKCDAIVELPMYGINKSLNVMVSTGIVLYEIIKCLP